LGRPTFEFTPEAHRKPGKRPAGFRLSVPDRLVVVPCGVLGPQFHALEYRSGSERVLGEIEIQVLSPALIMDRDGVLQEIARNAIELITGQKDADLHPINLPASDGWQAELVVTKDRAGKASAYPYVSVIALGHPDPMVPFALLIVKRSVQDSWETGNAMLESLELAAT
jgi:hypothetical protein